MPPFEMSQIAAEYFAMIGIIATAIMLFFLAAYILDFLLELIKLYLKSEIIQKIVDEYEQKEKQKREEKELQWMKKKKKKSRQSQ